MVLFFKKKTPRSHLLVLGRSSRELKSSTFLFKILVSGRSLVVKLVVVTLAQVVLGNLESKGIITRIVRLSKVESVNVWTLKTIKIASFIRGDETSSTLVPTLPPLDVSLLSSNILFTKVDTGNQTLLQLILRSKHCLFQSSTWLPEKKYFSIKLKLRYSSIRLMF